MAAISDLAIHDAWLPVGQFREYLHEKYCYADDIQFNTNRLISLLKNLFPNQYWNPMSSSFLEARRWSCYSNMSIKRRAKVDKDYISVTEDSVIAITILLTSMNSSAWEEKCIPLKKQLRRSGSWGCDDQNFRDGHRAVTSPSITSPWTLDKEVALLTTFNSTISSTMTSVGEERKSPNWRRTTRDWGRGKKQQLLN